MMKKTIFSLCLLLASTALQAEEVMTKKADGTYVVRTTTICKARGYRKTTPVEVHIKKGVVQKVVALKNEATVPYFEKIKRRSERLSD